MTKHVTIADFLTEAQIKAVIAIYNRGGRAKEICEQVIRPNMGAINTKLGQENDPMYLAYACEYVCSQGGG